MSKVVKPDCDACLNSQTYGDVCDQNPMYFEPEHKYIRTGPNSVESDYSGIPKDREIYCRNFIPLHWKQCSYVDGKWRIGEDEA